VSPHLQQLKEKVHFFFTIFFSHFTFEKRILFYYCLLLGDRSPIVLSGEVHMYPRGSCMWRRSRCFHKLYISLWVHRHLVHMHELMKRGVYSYIVLAICFVTTVNMYSGVLNLDIASKQANTSFLLFCISYMLVPLFQHIYVKNLSWLDLTCLANGLLLFKILNFVMFFFIVRCSICWRGAICSSSCWYTAYIQ